MTKYYFKSKSTGNIFEVSESEYRVVRDSYNNNFKEVSHMVVRDNCCNCEKSTLYVEEADMPSEEVKDNYDYDYERLRDEYDNEELTLDIDRADLPEDLLELHDKNIWEGYL